MGPLREVVMGPALAAVIFDVDGVLVRSMERNAEAYQRTLEPLGLRIQPQEVFANEGRGSRELIDLLAKAHGVTLSGPQRDDATRRHHETLASFGPMPLYPGVEELLRGLHSRGLRLALVTGNWRAIALAPFGDLAALFDTVVSAEEVTRTKPDPEPYRKALEDLGVPAERAAVVENAPLGIESAKAAGLRVIAVATTNPADRLREADLVVADLRDVGRALQALEGR